MLSLQGLRSGYGTSEVLHGVSMEVPDGKITVLIGPNGAGKSTLLKTVMSLVRPTSGRVQLGNDEITGLNTRSVIAKGLFYVGQGAGVFPNMTVEENLAMGGYMIGSDARRSRMKEVFNLFPVFGERKTQKAGFLSGGERQMLTIGRALVSSPKLLLLDEPSLGLDVGRQQLVLDKLKELNETGLTILLVEQNLSAAKVADLAYVLNQGQIKYEGSPRIFDDRQATSKLFFGEVRKA